MCGCRGLLVPAGVLLLVARVGVSDRPPAGPAARPLRPVLAGARRGAGPARGGGACGRRRRVRRRPRRQAAGGTGRRRRAGTESRQGGRRKRVVGGAGARRPGVAAGGAGRRARRCRGAGDAGPSLPQRRRPRHTGAARTARGAVAAAWRNRRAANLFRDRRTAERDVGVGQPADVGARRAARRGRWRCCCSAGPTRRTRTARRRAGGSPSAGRPSQGETLPEAAVRELAEETGLRVEPADMVGPVWRRDAVIDFNGSVIRSEEMFFVHRTSRFEPSTAGPHGAGAAPTSTATAGAMRQ